MHARVRLGVFVGAAFLLGTGGLTGQQPGQSAPDFPAGIFTDGNQHQLSDYKGKVVVLYFFENKWPRCKASIPERNALVKAMQNQPVKFLAIMPNISADEVMAYQRSTGLVMPVYVDNLGLMQKRYGIQISLQNIWQFRVVGPEGKVVAFDASKESLEKILASAKPEWKYRSDGYDAKLDPVIDALEWGQYPQAMKLLGPARKNKALAESANKLFDAVKKEGAMWKTEADGLAESEPVKSYDLYIKVATVFAGDELAKSVAEPLKKLSKDKAVVAELTARRAYATFLTGMGKVSAAQKPQALKACEDLAKKHAGTPTGEKAANLAKDLGG